MSLHFTLTEALVRRSRRDAQSEHMNQEYLASSWGWWSLYYLAMRRIHGWLADLPADQP
jgi:hypothetical protein